MTPCIIRASKLPRSARVMKPSWPCTASTWLCASPLRASQSGLWQPMQVVDPRTAYLGECGSVRANFEFPMLVPSFSIPSIREVPRWDFPLLLASRFDGCQYSGISTIARCFRILQSASSFWALGGTGKRLFRCLVLSQFKEWVPERLDRNRVKTRRVLEKNLNRVDLKMRHPGAGHVFATNWNSIWAFSTIWFPQKVHSHW